MLWSDAPEVFTFRATRWQAVDASVFGFKCDLPEQAVTLFCCLIGELLRKVRNDNIAEPIQCSAQPRN